MSEQSSTALAATRREPSHSRETRRLRRAGLVPGIVYGGEQQPVAFAINARELRNTLAHAGAVLDLTIDSDAATPVVLKELVRHPVSGETTHIDLLRVNLSVSIETQVALELVGAEDAPGVKQGGILEHILREVTVDALPNQIPDSITVDVSDLEIGQTIQLSAVATPDGVTIVHDLEAPVATISSSRAARAGGEEGDEIETETELVGDAAADAGSGADSAE